MKLAARRTLLATAALALTITGCSMGSKNIAPEPVAAPEPVMAPEPAYVIEGVTFDFNKATLKPAATETLDKVAAELRKQTEVAYEVAGFTDNSGPEAYNQGLSERRAIAVRDYLVDHGVSAEQLTVRGHGESNPVASNATKAGRAKNRRVEIRPTK